ncbi:MAG: methyl-accepting chemotaxis protein [Azoarcus sp.]|nr:methyl-accepting chemotaxis protein [Azoarcus sp.]
MLANFRIGTRLSFVFAAIVIAFSIACASIFVFLRNADEEAVRINAATIPKSALGTSLLTKLLHMRVAMRDVIFRSGEKDTKAGEAIVKLRKGMLADLDAFEKIAGDRAYEIETDAINGLKTGLTKAEPLLENLIRHGLANDIDAAAADLDQVMAVLYASSTSLEKMEAFEQQRVTERASHISTEIERAKITLIACSLAMLVLAPLAGFFVTRTITSPLGRMVETIEAVADGDLTRMIAVESKDEIGTLQSSLRHMSENLVKMIADVRNDAKQLAASATELSGSADNVHKGSEQQSDAASAIAAALEQMSTSIGHVSTLSDDARQTSIEAGKTADSGSTAIHSMVNEIRHVAEAIGDGASKAQQLGTESERISTIIHVIRDVADQTNLLALNAAIEAARAGEQGRGFAVVADEVRKLAEKTTASAQEITEMVNSIQSGSGQMTAQMETTAKRMQEGVDMAQDAGGAIGKINIGAQAVVKMIDEVSVALKEQATASRDIAGKIEQIVLMAEENSHAIGSVADSAGHLNALATTLNGAVEHFRIPG